MRKLNTDIIARLVWQCSYLKKDGTTGYNADYISGEVLGMKKGSKEKMCAMAEEYQKHKQAVGVQLLPSSFYFTELKTKKSGRGAKPSVGTLSAHFRAFEDSPYKHYKPYQVRTKIWEIDGLGCWYYGTPAISQSDGNVGKDNGDLLMIHTRDWKTLEVYIFKGMGNPQGLLDALEYLKLYNQ